MGKIYDYKGIHNLKDLKNKQQELQNEGNLHEQSIKEGVKTYIHQYSPGYLINKYTKKPKEKVASLFHKVKSWFSGKKKS
ncbi:hypothetical protein [Pedobacter steynii]|uniref:Uncharacterized protein n=1 Tax=Pedobacter steynii TaxID=430522 RepID=A0A1D7QMI1_9SPHI|nr:hypothetical protein [Pedobacter steynii]AOM79875.1 hypothetical protein BFS30_23545 [Pedobacter steynii]